MQMQVVQSCINTNTGAGRKTIRGKMTKQRSRNKTSIKLDTYEIATMGCTHVAVEEQARNGSSS
jgi:hypothetical protein